MAYPPRIELPSRVYHVNAKAVAGCKLFRDDDDRETFLTLLRREIARSSWKCLAYSLMSTHYHVLLRLEKCTLSSGFQHLNAGYARWFNRKYGRRGALWQRRFHDRLIESDRHLLEVNRYIALNAPRASMCVRPEDHLWCGYRAAIGLCPPDPLVEEDELLGLFGTRPETARRRLRAFVDERDPRERLSQRRV
jgi:REP-associated tyrosine transposase